MLKLVLIALEILKRIQQSRGTIKVSLTYQSQCSGITYQDALRSFHTKDRRSLCSENGLSGDKKVECVTAS